jgi:hypothetical protein
MEMATVVFNRIGEKLETKTGVKILTSFMIKDAGVFRPLKNGEKTNISLESAKAFSSQGLCEIVEIFTAKGAK